MISRRYDLETPASPARGWSTPMRWLTRLWDGGLRSPPPAVRLRSGFQLVKHLVDAGDRRVLRVKVVERAGEANRIARIVPLVKLLPSGEGRHCGIEGEPEQLDPGCCVGIGRLRVS